MISLRFGGDPAATIECIASRDLVGAIYAAGWCKPNDFVWPDTYKKIYRRQVLEPNIPGFPVLMRGVKPIMIDKYGKTRLAMKAFERWIKLYRITCVDKSAFDFWEDRWPCFARRFGVSASFSKWPSEQLRSWHRAVYVNGKTVSLDKERIEQLERAVKLVEKIEKLAA